MKVSETQDATTLVLVSYRKPEAKLEVIGWLGVAREPEYQDYRRHGPSVMHGVRLDR